MAEYEVQHLKVLRKNLSLGRSVGLVIGSVLGSGLMILPGLVYNQVGVYSFYSWLGMGLIIIPFLYVFTQIMTKYPSAGGLVNVIYLVLGNRIGLSITYTLIISLIMLVPIVAIIGANYLCYLFNLPSHANIFVAWVLLSVFTFLNTFDTKISLRIQGVASVILIFLLLFIVVISLLGSNDRLLENLTVKNFELSDIKHIWLGMTIVFWAFLGWENLSFTTEEFKNIKKDFNIIIISSYLLMMFLYLGLSAGVISLLDANNPKTISAPLAEVVRLSLGSISGVTVAGVAFLIMLININAWVWGPSRLVFDAGRKKALPLFFADLNQHHTPSNALYALLILYTLVLGIFYVLGQEFIVIPIKQVNCIFLFLYLLSVVAYIKENSSSLYAKLVSLIAAAIIIVFLSRFGYYLILPIVLLASSIANILTANVLKGKINL